MVALVPARIRRVLSWAALFVAAAARPAGADSSVEPLTEDDAVRLAAGHDVVRPERLEIDRRQYVGGLAYVVVDARPEDIARVVVDPEAMRQILPRTEFVLPVGHAGLDDLFELHQGNSLVHARYTLRVRSEPERNRMRFWLDRSRPHSIDDAWGFFRWEPFTTPSGPAVLVTFGILIDVGPGLVRALYEDRVRAMALTVPGRLREYVMRDDRTHPRHRDERVP